MKREGGIGKESLFKNDISSKGHLLTWNSEMIEEALNSNLGKSYHT